MLHTGKVEIDALALTPIMHGAGTRGNVQIIRTEKVLQPDGSIRRVPFVSGNAIKHTMVRAPGALWALAAMGVDGGLAKELVDLLFSGGHLSATGKGSVDLAASRRVAELFPILSLCGYSAGNRIEASKISVDHLQLVCKENEHRLGAAAAALPAAQVPRKQLQDECFGTRHEATGDPNVGRLLEAGQREELDLAVSKRASKEDKQSSQMIYSFEAVIAGSRWCGAIHYKNVTDLERAALQAALEYGMKGVTHEGRYIYHIAGKSAVGYGQIGVRFGHTERMHIRTPETAEAGAIVKADSVQSDLERYAAHLQENREEILTLLGGLG